VRRRRLAVLVLLAAFIGFGGALAAGQTPRVGDATPEIAGQPWINGGPLTMAALRGRVVLVEFWTYG
jgi:ABC-type nitrate/sulfonate/bicarbonate transport system substrate-binding protein